MLVYGSRKKKGAAAMGKTAGAGPVWAAGFSAVLGCALTA